MARAVKPIEAEPAAAKDLRCSILGEKERASVILLRRDGVGMVKGAARVGVTAKRASKAKGPDRSATYWVKNEVLNIGTVLPYLDSNGKDG